MPYGTLGLLRGGTGECHMALLGWKGLNSKNEINADFNLKHANCDNTSN